ncbi:MAG: hypothetical protein KUG68_04565 [Flavobacteriaceae bacterium]|nr:hypothetical protein [Flavobacteriaceae bacterium]
MKTIKKAKLASKFIGLIFFLFAFSYANAQVLTNKKTDLNKPEAQIQEDVLWSVKAYRPDDNLLKIKAIDKAGNVYDVKAIQDSPDTKILNVKVLFKNKVLPIKLIAKDNEMYYPAKAIDENGNLLEIKAITEDGTYLDVKGIRKTGNIIHMRAITSDSDFYNIVAVSPKGKVNTVKGVKMIDADEESVINGVSIFAHLKAISQK